MISNEIFEKIDDVVTESNIDVIEAMCVAYDKAYDILEYCTDDDTNLELFTIIQEATIDEGDSSDDINADAKKKKKSKKQGNILIRILDAIISFFRMIGSAIASFFKKAKDTVSEKLRKLSKKSDSACDKVQDDIDNGPAGKKIGKAKKKFKDNTKPNPELTDNDDDKDESGDTEIVVKEKKVRSHIKFDSWIKFLEYSYDYTEKIVNKVDGFTKASTRSAIANRPSRVLQKKVTNTTSFTNKNKPITSDVDKVQGLVADKWDDFWAGSDTRKARMKKTKLFTKIPRMHPVSKVADDIDKINDLLSKNVESAKAALEKFNKIKSVIDDEPNERFKKLARDITKIHTELANVGKIIISMAKYLGQELGLYDAMLDIIIPMFDKAESDKKKADEEANPTVNVNVRTKKDDEDEKDEDK